MMRGGHVSAVDERLDRREAKHVLRKSGQMLRRYRRQLIRTTVLLVLQTGAMVGGPRIIKFGIDHGVEGKDPGMINLSAAIFLLVAVVGYFAGRAAIYGVAWIGETFLRDLRKRVFDHITSLSLDFFEKGKTGVVVSRMTADMEAIQQLLSQGLVMFVINGLVFAGTITIMLVTSPILTAVTLVVVPPVAVATVWFRKAANKAYLRLRDRIGDTLASFQEGLSGIRVVQAFRQEPATIRRFADANEGQYGAHMHTIRISARYFPVIELSGVVTMAVILYSGGSMLGTTVTVGTITAFVLWAMNLFEPIQQLGQLYNQVQQSGAALQKLFGLLEEEASVDEPTDPAPLPERGSLEVEGVTFAYDDEPVLRGVSCSAASGERIALVGPTGAGKSTLAKIAARFYDPDHGRVRFGGVDLRDASLEQLRERIVVLPQEGFLFNGTIRDNIRIGRPEATDADVERAIERLGLTERFAELPEGLETQVQERGTRLSAGERQLVSLVRVALVDPAVLVLDEATSSVDPGTELLVEAAMAELMEGRTVILIAHRLTTAARADRILVVEGGEIVERGTHSDLVSGEGRYAALFASWSAGTGEGEEPDPIRAFRP